MTNKNGFEIRLEVLKMAKEMMAAAGAVFNPVQQTAEDANKTKAAASEDWSSYM